MRTKREYSVRDVGTLTTVATLDTWAEVLELSRRFPSKRYEVTLFETHRDGVDIIARDQVTRGEIDA